MDYDDRPEPAQRLQKARESAGFAAARQAATRFGWSYDTYLQHENGTRGIGRAAGRYAKAYKVSEAWLLTGEGPAPGEEPSLDEEFRLLPPDAAELLRSQVRVLVRHELDKLGIRR